MGACTRHSCPRHLQAGTRLFFGMGSGASVGNFSEFISTSRFGAHSMFGRAGTDLTAGATLMIAYVVPAFEVKAGAAPPSSPGEVVAAMNRTVQPFYFDLCWKCQRHTNYPEWLRLERPPPPWQYSYPALWHDPWEPFFITETAATPSYDERFRQYGFNRISQVWKRVHVCIGCVDCGVA